MTAAKLAELAELLDRAEDSRRAAKQLVYESSESAHDYAEQAADYADDGDPGGAADYAREAMSFASAADDGLAELGLLLSEARALLFRLRDELGDDGGPEARQLDKLLGLA